VLAAQVLSRASQWRLDWQVTGALIAPLVVNIQLIRQEVPIMK
jgi:hypothetical protein